MPEIEWVKERAACGVRAVFDRLKTKAATDVDMRNALRQDGDAYSFKVREQGPDEFDVVREGKGMPTQWVMFLFANHMIHVQSSGDADVKIDFQATTVLNEKGECRVKVKDESLEEWEVRKRALEALFFYVYGRAL